MCLALLRSCLAGGRCSNSLVRSVTPLSFHRSLPAAGVLMAFKCLARAHTIPIGPVPVGREIEGSSPVLGGSYWGEVSPGAFGTHQAVALARVPPSLPQQLACSQRVPRNEDRRWGKRSLDWPPNVVVRTRAGKEFPDIRQNVKKIEFIKGNGHCLHSGLLPSSLGERSPNMCYASVFIASKTKEWSEVNISFTDWSRHIHLPS